MHDMAVTVSSHYSEGGDCDVPIAEASVAAMHIPNTPNPMISKAVSLMSMTQNQSSIRKDRRNPESHIQALFLTTVKPQVHGEQKRQSGSRKVGSSGKCFPGHQFLSAVSATCGSVVFSRKS